LIADDILSTIVELSVAVAGFSGIVAALAPSRPTQWPFVAQTLFSALLVSTAASASISLLAMVLLASPVSPAIAWATASGLHGVFLLGVIAIRIRQSRRVDARIPPYAFLTLAVMSGIALIQLVNASRLQVGWLCVASLALYASMGFVCFILLVTSLWEFLPAARQGDELDVE
jgi:hypothetical protein